MPSGKNNRNESNSLLGGNAVAEYAISQNPEGAEMLSNQEPFDARAHELGNGTDESDSLVGDNSRVISHAQSTVMNPQ